MNILQIKKEEMSQHGRETTCEVFSVHVQVTDIGSEAAALIKLITDTNWIEALDVATKRAFEVRAKKTIDHLVSQILEKINDAITEEFGEYLVSATAQRALVEGNKHIAAPLAELWKERVIGNPGFDFHSCCEHHLITFGEAKYSSTINPYTAALQQIGDFVDAEKDAAELADLKNFFCHQAIENHLGGQKAFAAAFFINSADPQTIMKNALQCSGLEKLLCHGKLYLIGVSLSAE